MIKTALFIAIVELYAQGGGKPISAPMPQMYEMREDRGGCNTITREIKEFYAKTNTGVVASVTCRKIKNTYREEIK